MKGGVRLTRGEPGGIHLVRMEAMNLLKLEFQNTHAHRTKRRRGRSGDWLPTENRWNELEPLPIAVHGVTGSALVNGWIHLPGGGTSTGGSSGATLHQIFWVNGIGP